MGMSRPAVPRFGDTSDMTISDYDVEPGVQPVACTAPRWFEAALATAAECGEVAVAGVPIRYRGWGELGGWSLRLVHGSAAHSR
jgi:hypothetical protein